MRGSWVELSDDLFTLQVHKVLVLYNGLCHDHDRTPRDATLSVPAGILSVRLT